MKNGTKGGNDEQVAATGRFDDVDAHVARHARCCLRNLDAEQLAAFGLLSRALSVFQDHAYEGGSQLSHAAAVAILAMLNNLSSGNLRSLRHMAGYKRSDELGALAHRCDAILEKWVKAGDRHRGVAEAVLFAGLNIDPGLYASRQVDQALVASVDEAIDSAAPGRLEEQHRATAQQ